MPPGGGSYPIASNTTYNLAVSPTFSVVVQAAVQPLLNLGATIELYEDDFQPLPGQPTVPPQLHVNPESDEVATAMYSMQSGGTNGTDRSKNRFADAYIEPAYDLGLLSRICG